MVWLLCAPSLYLLLAALACQQFSLVFTTLTSLTAHLERSPGLDGVAPREGEGEVNVAPLPVHAVPFAARASPTLRQQRASARGPPLTPPRAPLHAPPRLHPGSVQSVCAQPGGDLWVR